jgi:flagellar basal body-associated protein FliL
MTSTPPSQPTEGRPGSRLRDRRVLALIGLAIVVVLILAAATAVWIVFFSSPAPAAPTLDDALRVLLPSASPAG